MVTEASRTPEVFEEIREDYEKLTRDERQQVKGIIVGMNLQKVMSGKLYFEPSALDNGSLDNASSEKPKKKRRPAKES